MNVAPAPASAPRLPADLAHAFARDIAFLIAKICLDVALAFCRDPRRLAQAGPFWRSLDRILRGLAEFEASLVTAAGTDPAPAQAHAPATPEASRAPAAARPPSPIPTRSPPPDFAPPVPPPRRQNTAWTLPLRHALFVTISKLSSYSANKATRSTTTSPPSTTRLTVRAKSGDPE